MERLHDIHDILGRHDYEKVMDTNIFHLDKPRIQQEVMVLIRRHGSHRCPMFSPRHMEAQMSRLPNVVHLKQQPMWRFCADPSRGPGVIYGCYRFPTMQTGGNKIEHWEIEG